MATYTELAQALGNDALINKVRIAVLIAAEAIRTEAGTTTNHAARLAWARQAYNDPSGVTVGMMRAVIAQNSAVPYATIIGADDATVQTAVNNAVNAFAF